MNYRHGPAFSPTKSLKKSISQMHQYNPIVPGPIYNVSGVGQKEPNLSYSVGKDKRTEINHRVQQTPSPVHYFPKKIETTIEKSIPKSSPIEVINQNPDPSCYINNEKHVIKKVLAYTLTSRQASIIMNPRNKNPGPGHYQSQQILPILTRSKSIKQASFGTDSRFNYKTNSNPGVGNYKVTTNKLSQFEQTYSVGKSQRPLINQQTPGPTNYSKLSFVQQSLRSKVGKTLAPRFSSTFQSNPTTTNAFHKYLQNPQQMFVTAKTNPKYSLGKQKRTLFKPSNNPGPNQYINNDFLIKHSSTALMPTAQRVQYDDSIYKPGPGTYQIQKQKGLQYSFSKSKSLSTVAYTDNPGVGRYKVDPKKSVKVNSFSKSKRFGKNGVNGVGVGDYDIEYKKQLKMSLSKISKSQRFKQQPQSSPGPGDYHIKSLISYKLDSDKL